MSIDASDPLFPAEQAPRSASVGELDASLIHCRACPRLVAWREQTARDKRAAFRAQEYWARPVTGLGPADARILIVGLAPAAHGGNRTGRMFTGDRSGDVLFAALHAVGLASQPTSVSRDDGLQLYGVRITAPVHCAPPQNSPSVQERDTCRPWFAREMRLLPEIRSVVALGRFGWLQTLTELGTAGWDVPRPAPVFAHGARSYLEPKATGDTRAPRPVELFGSYHVSQQNTFTGRLTPGMLQAVLAAAADSAGVRRG